jgi:hypothetical protein
LLPVSAAKNRLTETGRTPACASRGGGFFGADGLAAGFLETCFLAVGICFFGFTLTDFDALSSAAWTTELLSPVDTTRSAVQKNVHKRRCNKFMLLDPLNFRDSTPSLLSSSSHPPKDYTLICSDCIPLLNFLVLPCQ